MLTYLRIPSWIYLRLKGQPHVLSVLLALIGERSTITNNTRFLTASDIAEISGISLREVYYCFKKLVDLGFIEKLTSERGKFMFHLPCIAKIEGVDEEESDSHHEKLLSEIEALLSEDSDDKYEVHNGVLRRECSTEPTS